MIQCDREIGNAKSDEPSHSNADRLKSRYDSISTSDDDLCKLKVIHANCQSAMNKRSEISGLIDLNDPHILALTEFGAAASVDDGKLGIEGFSLYRGDHSSGTEGLG